jgi:hypothetical protein
MKKSLLFILFIIFTITLKAQKDSVDVIRALPQRVITSDASKIKVTIFPVPVRNNSFSIKTDRDISFIKITNIIGQDIFKTQYNNPQQLINILLNNPKRGMYLVTILFSDGNRVVKKIMIEESE